jgi:hypothetical protein
MSIWCIKIGIVLVLHPPRPNHCFTYRSRIFHLFVTSQAEKNWGLCSALWAFEQGRIFIVPEPNKCKGMTRCLGGGSILYLPVTPAVCPRSKLVIREHPSVEISYSGTPVVKTSLETITYCLVLCLAQEFFLLIWRRHHCRWRAVNLGLCSAVRAFEQGWIFIVPHLLPETSCIELRDWRDLVMPNFFYYSAYLKIMSTEMPLFITKRDAFWRTTKMGIWKERCWLGDWKKKTVVI